MPNPILQALGSKNANSSTNPNLGNVQKLINTIKSAKNPEVMLNSLAKSNPNVQYVLNLANQYKNPKEAFYSFAKEKGVDPNEIINMLK